MAETPHDEAPGARRRRAVAADRWRALVENARAKTEGARRWAEEERGRSRPVTLGFDLFERDRARLGGLIAGALAYRLFFWLLPFSLFLVGTLGALTSLDDGTPNEISAHVGLQGFIAETISDGARQRGWWIALLIGLLGALYAGIGVVRALRISHAAAWGIPPSRARNLPKASMSLMGIAIGLLLVSLLIGWLRSVSFAGGLIALLAMTAVYFVVWVAVSSRLPHRGVPARALMPGALLVAVGVQGLHLFTVYYLAGRAERAASLYGTIGAALTLLLWLYIIARLMVGGAILNATLAGEHDRVQETA